MKTVTESPVFQTAKNYSFYAEAAYNREDWNEAFLLFGLAVKKYGEYFNSLHLNDQESRRFVMQCCEPCINRVKELRARENGSVENSIQSNPQPSTSQFAPHHVGPRNENLKQPASNNGCKPGTEKTNELKEYFQMLFRRQRPRTSFDDIMGNAGVKNLMQTTVLHPLKFPHIFSGKRKPAKNILMFGPSGCGKTVFALALANEGEGMEFASVKGSDILRQYYGQSERQLRMLFEVAQENKPCIIFIDEIDGLFSRRQDGGRGLNTLVNEFLTQVDDERNEGVVIIGATNLPWALDEAVRRRFGKFIYVPLPEQDDRIEIFKHYLGSEDAAMLNESNFRQVGVQTLGYSSSDLQNLAKEVLLMPWLRTQHATSFYKKEQTTEAGGDSNYSWVACHSNRSNAVKLEFGQINPIKLGLPRVCMDDVRYCLSQRSSSIDPNANTGILKQLIEFRDLFAPASANLNVADFGICDTPQRIYNDNIYEDVIYKDENINTVVSDNVGNEDNEESFCSSILRNCCQCFTAVCTGEYVEG